MESLAIVTESDFDLAINDDPHNILTHITDSLVISQDEGKIILAISFHVEILTGNATHDTRLLSAL